MKYNVPPSIGAQICSTKATNPAFSFAPRTIDSAKRPKSAPAVRSSLGPGPAAYLVQVRRSAQGWGVRTVPYSSLSHLLVHLIAPPPSPQEEPSHMISSRHKNARYNIFGKYRAQRFLDHTLGTTPGPQVRADSPRLGVPP